MGAVMKSTKASVNPKNLAAKSRIKVALLPAAGIIHGAHAAMAGAGKYGPYNWRDQKIALMEYASAMQRHIMDWVDGQDISADDRCHHLGHVIACASIMLDAIEVGAVIDDRPTAGAAAAILDRLSKPKDD